MAGTLDTQDPGAIQGHSIAPDLFSREDGPAPPAVEVRPMFIYAFHPRRWMVLAGKLVPGLRQVALVPGVERVWMDEERRIHFADTRAKLEENGWKLIPHHLAPDGVSYVQVLQTKPVDSNQILETHLTVWETAYPGLPDTESDLDGYTAWLEGLVEAGTIPPCPAYVAGRMLERTRQLLTVAEARVAKGATGLSHRVEVLRVHVKVLEAAVKAKGKGKPLAKGRAKAPALD